MITEFEALTQRTKELLQKSEGIDVEFKRDIEGLKQDVIVSFANSKYGGEVLIGVLEIEALDGTQKGKVYGCKVGDKIKTSIQNLANQTIPPIPILIFTENLATKTPIIRVKIESGRDKPYCTASGVYCTRTDGAKRLLHPDELLDIFLEKESKKFFEKFNDVTLKLNRRIDEVTLTLDKIDKRLVKKVDNAIDDINRLSKKIEKSSIRLKKRKRKKRKS